MRIDERNTMTKYKLIIEADTNDADYVSAVNEVNKETIEKLYPVFDAIKAFKPYETKTDGKIDGEIEMDWTHDSNWPVGDALRPDLGEKSPQEIYPNLTPKQVEMFNDLCPYGEYGFHTITKITVVEYISEKEYL